jgi:hypothetical protein
MRSGTTRNLTPGGVSARRITLVGLESGVAKLGVGERGVAS